jgi:hypothetical protein
MRMYTYRLARSPWLLAATVGLLGACSHGGGDSTAPLSISLTDAPIDTTNIDRVCISFNRVTLHYASGEDVEVDYSPPPALVTSDTHCLEDGGVWDGADPVPPVRLDALSGELTVALVESTLVPTGLVTWIRLHFLQDASYVWEIDPNVSVDLSCPSCEVTDNDNDGRGFKLNHPFEITEAGLALTVDVELTQSLLHMNSMGYVLRPVTRVELDATLGTISGTVASELLAADALDGSTYGDGNTDVDTGCSVYVYPDGTLAADDYDMEDPAAPVITSSRVRYNLDTGEYVYAAGALEAGDYGLAVTCDMDDPEVDEMVSELPDTGGEVVFTSVQGATVVAGQRTTLNF